MQQNKLMSFENKKTEQVKPCKNRFSMQQNKLMSFQNKKTEQAYIKVF